MLRILTQGYVEHTSTFPLRIPTEYNYRLSWVWTETKKQRPQNQQDCDKICFLENMLTIPLPIQ